jgi:tetrahydromethanopterin S-methyltransferase subunit D
VVAGLGIAAGIYLGRIKLAAGCGLGGFGIAAAARFWQQYAEWLVLAVGVLLVAAMLYVIYYAAEHRKAFMRQLWGQGQNKEGKRIKGELSE